MFKSGNFIASGLRDIDIQKVLGRKRKKTKKYKKLGKIGFGKISFFGGPPAPSFMGNFQMFFKKVQCRFPGYLVLKFCNKLTDSSPDHSAHLFLNHFGPWEGP